MPFYDDDDDSNPVVVIPRKVSSPEIREIRVVPRKWHNNKLYIYTIRVRTINIIS